MKHLILFEAYVVTTNPVTKLLRTYNNWTVKWNHNTTYNHDILARIQKRTGLSIEEINEKLKKVIDRIEVLVYSGHIKEDGDYAFKMKNSDFTFLINIDTYDTANSLYIRTILDKGMKIYSTEGEFTLFEGKKYENIEF